MKAVLKRIEKKEEIRLMLRILNRELKEQLKLDEYCANRNQFNELGKIHIKILKKKIKKKLKKWYAINN